MRKKLLVTITLTGALALSLGTASAWAATTTPLCGYTDCTNTALHLHDGIAYQGHYYGDGHDHASTCSVTDCQQLGYHTHNTHHSRGHHGGHHC